MQQKTVIGLDAKITFVGLANDVPAKIDTGADTSAVWASDIFVDKDGLLHYKLFGKGAPYYTGEEIVTKDYSVASVKSASGNVTIKYKVKLPIKIKRRLVRAVFGLSERSTHKYPVLIGRSTLRGKFLVDVKKKGTDVANAHKESETLNRLMRKDPYAFYKEHYLNGGEKWKLLSFQMETLTIPPSV